MRPLPRYLLRAMGCCKRELGMGGFGYWRPQRHQPVHAPFVLQSVRICDNVWIGMGAVILPGVTIGDDSVVVAGNPARIVLGIVIGEGTP